VGIRTKDADGEGVRAFSRAKCCMLSLKRK